MADFIDALHNDFFTNFARRFILKNNSRETDNRRDLRKLVQGHVVLEEV